MADGTTRARANGRREPPASRIATAHLRRRPDFVIIGAQRGGTTSLYDYLTSHPDVGPAWRKEVHFFDKNYGKGIAWYLAHFPRWDEAKATGEASPYYLLHPDAPRRMRQTLPEARLIALLRDPVARAYSQYQLNVRRGIEPLSFESAIERELARAGAESERVGPTWRRSSYLARGRYAEQIERWLVEFPCQQLLILKSEDVFADPEPAVYRVLDYLGLPRWRPARFKVRHRSVDSCVDRATARRLYDYFAPHNRRLRELLGADFGWPAIDGGA